MRFISWIIVAFLFLTGCTRYTALIQPNTEEQLAIEHTRKGEIMRSLETKAVILATHMNPIDPASYNDGEVFFIDLYVTEDQWAAETPGLKDSNVFTLTLEGADPLSIEQLSKDDAIFNHLSNYNRWSKHYKVRFPEASAPSLSMQLMMAPHGSAELEFRTDRYVRMR